jgi:hypothetical protein
VGCVTGTDEVVELILATDDAITVVGAGAGANPGPAAEGGSAR